MEKGKSVPELPLKVNAGLISSSYFISKFGDDAISFREGDRSSESPLLRLEEAPLGQQDRGAHRRRQRRPESSGRRAGRGRPTRQGDRAKDIRRLDAPADAGLEGEAQQPRRPTHPEVRLHPCQELD